MQIQYKRVASENELRQILNLQQKNTISVLSSSEQMQEGFITVSHTYEILKQMNDECAHIIAKDGDLVVGYALAMASSLRNEIALLTPMFISADELLSGRKYIAMGQICVDKNYRKKGIFREMYAFYREQLQYKYDCLVTEVATENNRSLQAHKSVGFKILKTEITDGVSWELMNWDWKLHSPSS